MLFASGGLGMAAAGNAMLCIGSFCLLVAVILGFVGHKLTKSKRKLIELLGVIIMMLGCALPFVVCSSFGGDSAKIESRRRIQKGMSQQEVIEAIGLPNRMDGKDWFYNTDLWGLYFYIVIFGDDDRVDRVFID